MTLKTKHRISNSDGFTLIELVISAAIIAVIGVVVTKFWINTAEAFTLDNNIAILKQQSERSTEIMAERIRRANAASIVISNGNATIDFVDSSDGSNVQYSLTPAAPAAPLWGEIMQTVNGAQGSIGGYVQSLQFTASPTGLVTIDAAYAIGTGRTQTALAVQCSAAARN